MLAEWPPVAELFPRCVLWAEVQVTSTSIILGAISVALYWTQEKGREGKDRGKTMGCVFKVLENFAFPLGYELFLSLVCSCSLTFDKQTRKLERL